MPPHPTHIDARRAGVVRPARRKKATASARLATALYVLGAVLIGAEGAVHFQQRVEIFHAVAWIGPLFALNAAGCAAVIAGLIPRRTRTLAAGVGIAISALALVALCLSYTVGVLGWTEVALRTPVLVAILAEAGATVALAGALGAERADRGRR